MYKGMNPLKRIRPTARQNKG